jgi:hypothetical protein
MLSPMHIYNINCHFAEIRYEEEEKKAPHYCTTKRKQTKKKRKLKF